jgi:lipoprotein-anchoring transpeptidase ErfK/SrfK
VKQIVVDLHTQKVIAFDGERAVYRFDCFTGDELTPTSVGHFLITWKDRNHVSSKYQSPMKYAMFFDVDGKAIHAGVHVGVRHLAMRAGIGKADNYQSVLKIGSHGCVNLAEADAQMLFDWAPEGTRIWVR